MQVTPPLPSADPVHPDTATQVDATVIVYWFTAYYEHAGYSWMTTDPFTGWVDGPWWWSRWTGRGPRVDLLDWFITGGGRRCPLPITGVSYIDYPTIDRLVQASSSRPYPDLGVTPLPIIPVHPWIGLMPVITHYLVTHWCGSQFTHPHLLAHCFLWVDPPHCRCCIT